MRFFLFILSVALLLLVIFVIYSPDNVIDQQLLIWAKQHQQPLLVRFFIILAYIGSLWTTAIIVTVMVAYHSFKGRMYECCLGYLGLIFTILFIWLSKWIFARPRPLINDQLVETYGSSFPSAHSAYAMVIAILIVVSFTRRDANTGKISILIGLWVLIMGYSRIYLGVHYFTDVLAGVLIASIVMLIVIMSLNRLGIKQH